jgi:hypothetical protein
VKIAVLFLFCIFSCSLLMAQESEPPDNPEQIPADQIPPAVVWGLALYGGITQPVSPYDFSEYWKTGFSISMEADILLKNNAILGLTFGYSRNPLNTPRFLQAKGLPRDGELPQDISIGITQILLSFKGMENYLLYRYDAGYEFGVGLYNLTNTQIVLRYWGPETGYTVTEGATLACGVFGGLAASYLITDTLQFSIKGRYHYVFVPARPHQFLDVLVGLTIL